MSIETSYIPIEQITSSTQIRSIKEFGVKRLEEKMKSLGGFLPNFPLLVTRTKTGYHLIDGSHRLEAARRKGIKQVPCQILTACTEELDCLRLAIQSNEASETIVPTTFVDQAELVWKLKNESKPLEDIAEVLGWSKEKIKQYSALSGICEKAWKIVVTTFETLAKLQDDDACNREVTIVTFTEGLLRDILQLGSDQQLSLVKDLAENKINKKQFKILAEAYRSRNEMTEHAKTQLGNLSQQFIDSAITEINKGAFDKEWIDNKRQPGQKLQKLLSAIQDEWELKEGIKVVHGDFNIEVLSIADSSIDLILTDPPYNLSSQSRVIKKGKEIINADFDGEDDWDTKNQTEFLESFIKSFLGF